MELLITLGLGIFIIVGALITFLSKNNKNFVYFSISLAFAVMVMLMFVDLIPEVKEIFISELGFGLGIFIALIGIVGGIIILKVLDFFIPDHHHDHHDNEKNKKEHISHMRHIGTLTLISLILHNLLEGFAIAGNTANNMDLGFMICLSVALHNIPLGTTIFSSLDIKKNKLLVLSLTLSSLLGGLIFLIIGNISLLALAIISIITMGMLMYIAILELLPELWQNITKKETIIGLFTGLIIIIIAMFI